jgi:hypothetical protein
MTRQSEDVPGRKGKVAGLPFDIRRPTTARLRDEAWNPKDARLFTPKAFGWGYGLNLYWVAHPAGYVKGRRAA